MVTAVKKVQPKRSVCHLIAKVAVGHRNHPRLDGPGFVSAHPHERAVLQDLQQLGLDANIQAAYLIQEQGPAVSLFQTAALGGMRPGERAFFVSEQFGLDQALRNRRTTHLHQLPDRSL